MVVFLWSAGLVWSVDFSHLFLTCLSLMLLPQEWEEKLNQSNEMVETYKEKYERLKTSAKGDLDVTTRMSTRTTDDELNDMSMYGSVKSAASGKASSVASLGSGLAQQAKTIVNSMNQFNCTAMNERNGASSVVADMREVDLTIDGRARRRMMMGPYDPPRSATSSASRKAHNSSRSLRDYSRSPQRVDV